MTQKDCPMVAAPCDELKDNTKALMDVRLELKGLTTEMRALVEINRKLENQEGRIESLEKLAAQLSEIAKSSHKRLNDMQAAQRWFIGITIPLVLGVVGLFFKFI